MSAPGFSRLWPSAGSPVRQVLTLAAFTWKEGVRRMVDWLSGEQLPRIC